MTKPDELISLAYARSLKSKLNGYLKERDYEAAAGVERELAEHALALAAVSAGDYEAICKMALGVSKLKFPRWG